MRFLSCFILTSLCVGAIAACAAKRMTELGDALPPAEAEVASREPLKLADAVVAGAPAKGDEKGDQKGENQPALPSGHPPVGGAQNNGLPAGHPNIGGGAAAPGGLPSGHPDIGQPGGLPSGHPAVGGAAATGPVDMNAKGSITIKASQGTAGGPAVGADAVLVEYYNAKGQVVGKSESKLNDKGEVTLADVSLETSVQPLITVTHQGVEYRAAGSVMSAAESAQSVEMTVFEATDVEPAWTIKMRHVILANSPAGVTVTDMIAVNNPTDRAWIGAKVSGGGKPVTLNLPLPAGATNVQFGSGFHECCTKVVEGRVVYSMALTPGDTQFQLSYTIAADRNGAARVDLTAPAATGQLMVFVAEDGTTFASDTLKRMETKKGANLRANARFFVSPPHEKGKTVGFTISGLAGVKPEQAQLSEPGPTDGTAAVAAATTANPASRVPGVAKVVGGIGAGAILVVGTVVVLFKGPRVKA
jgi:hypothetical protein